MEVLWIGRVPHELEAGPPGASTHSWEVNERGTVVGSWWLLSS
jgi:hypothetical protein